MNEAPNSEAVQKTPEELRANLVEHLQNDPRLALKLGVEVGRRNFYSSIDRGYETFDRALDMAMRTTVWWTEYFQDIAETGTIPEASAAEEDGCVDLLGALEGANATETGPSETRKKLAKVVLREEFQTGRRRVPLTWKRRRQFVEGAEV